MSHNRPLCTETSVTSSLELASRGVSVDQPAWPVMMRETKGEEEAVGAGGIRMMGEFNGKEDDLISGEAMARLWLWLTGWLVMVCPS